MNEGAVMPAGPKIGEISEVILGQTLRVRVLAIDYGRKRIGLALSDEMGLTAQPFATFVRTNRKSDLRRLREICRANDVQQIVVGHPVKMSGERGEMAHEAARFAARLEKDLGIAVELQDERLTSWEAEQIAAESKPAAKRKRRSLDDVAAAILLREYLDSKRSGTNAAPRQRG